jgi:hypothetical protein
VTKTVSHTTGDDDISGPYLPFDFAASYEHLFLRNVHRCGCATDDPRISRRYVPSTTRWKPMLIPRPHQQLSATRLVSDFHRWKRSSWSTRRCSYQFSSACCSSSTSLLSWQLESTTVSSWSSIYGRPSITGNSWRFRRCSSRRLPSASTSRSIKWASLLFRRMRKCHGGKKPLARYVLILELAFNPPQLASCMDRWTGHLLLEPRSSLFPARPLLALERTRSSMHPGLQPSRGEPT